MKTDILKTRIKINDGVVVVSGDDRGKRGKVLNVNRTNGRIIIEGINKIKKFVKASQENPKGGVLVIERPLEISNVMYFCEKCKKGVRISVEIKDKKKNRTCGKCAKNID